MCIYAWICVWLYNIFKQAENTSSASHCKMMRPPLISPSKKKGGKDLSMKLNCIRCYGSSSGALGSAESNLSHWVPHSCGLVLHLSKRLSKFPPLSEITFKMILNCIYTLEALVTKRLLSLEMKSATRFQILNVDICHSLYTEPIYQPLRSGRIWHKVNF